MSRECWQVSELIDVEEPLLPRYVVAHRRDQRPWMVTYWNRDKINSRLALWCRQLAAVGREPSARVFLGASIGLPESTALALARWRICEVNRFSTGDPGRMADFLCNEVSRQGVRRPVAMIQGGKLTVYPSESAAADAAGLSVPGMLQRVRRGAAFDAHGGI